MPATRVPWPLSSSVRAVFFTKLYPASTLPARSGWPESTPVSMMAIVTGVVPVTKGHAWGPSIFVRAHSFENSGSFG